MYKVSDIDDYQNRLTENQKKLVVRHCKKYSIEPTICAWYDDMDDFYSDWVDSIGYTKTTARAMRDENRDEFKTFSNGTIIRFVK